MVVLLLYLLTIAAATALTGYASHRIGESQGYDRGYKAGHIDGHALAMKSATRESLSAADRDAFERAAECAIIRWCIGKKSELINRVTSAIRDTK